MNSEMLIKAGAILLPKAKLPKDILSDDVVARAWTHPALDAPIVRIPTQNMLRGIDLEMGLLGFAEPEDRGVIGKKRREKLGFPGWALVNDPDHARFALDVVKDLKKAARKIKSKPGTAKELIDGIGTRLSTSVPHFLPSFYEEAARNFIAFENYTYAAQYFEKARNAERVYALEVDREMREQTFVDFALARALSVKSLTNFGLEMIEKGQAKEGFESYFRIAIRRTKGGLPPSPAMAKDLKRLAKAAGLDPAEEERNFLRELLGAAALRMAPAGFWKAYNKSLKALAKEDPAARSGMLDLFPNMHPNQWFEVLDSCDACRSLFDDSVEKESKSKHTTADWFGLVLKQQNNAGWRGAKNIAGRILTLLVECADRLKEDGIPIPIPEGWWGVNPDIIETGLAAGVRFALPENVNMVTLNDIVAYKEEPGKCLDWEFISKDETFRPLAIASIESASGYMHSWIELLADRPFLRELIDEWLTNSVGSLSTNTGIVGSYTSLSRFCKFPKLIWAYYPKQAETLMATDIAIPLKNTLNIGIWDEFGWPILDQTLATFANPPSVRLVDNFPHLILFDKTQVKVIGAEGIVLEAEIPTHKEAVIEDMIYTKDTLLLIYKKGWREHGQWLGTPTLFEIDDRLEYRGTPIRLSDGRAMFNGCRIITPGDQKFPNDYERAKTLFSDGKHFWYLSNEKYINYDPITGKVVEGPNPPFLQEGKYSGWVKHIPNAAKNSPIGVKDDVAGSRVITRDEEGNTKYEDIAGNKYEGLQSPNLLFNMVGDSTPRLYKSQWRGFELCSVDGVTSVVNDHRFRKGGFPNIPELFLGYFEPRDEIASKILRTISTDLCTTFLKEAVEGENELRVSLVKSFPELKDANMRAGLAGIIRLAAAQRQMLDELNKEVAAVKSAVVETYAKDPENMGSVFEGLVNVGARTHTFIEQIKDVTSYFTRDDSKNGEGKKAQDGSGMWEDAIGYLGAFAFRAALPVAIGETKAVHEASIETLKLFLYTVADSPFVGADLTDRLRYFRFDRLKEDDEYLTPDWRKLSGETELVLERGVAMTTYQGNDFFTWGAYSTIAGFELARSGTFSDILSEPVGNIQSGWGTREELDAFFALLDEKGPLPVLDALPTFMELTGLTEPEASLAAANWQSPHLVKMKAGTRDWASEACRSQPLYAKEFFNNVVTAGPLEELWDSEKLAKRLAEIWLGGNEKPIPINVEFIEAFKRQMKYGSTVILRNITNVDASPLLNAVPKGKWKNGYHRTGVNAEGFIVVLAFAMHNARIGSQVYKNVVRAFELIRQQLAHPDYLVSIFSSYNQEFVSEMAKMLKGTSEAEPGNTEKIVGSDGLYLSSSNWQGGFYANWDMIQKGHPLIEKLGLEGLKPAVTELRFILGSDVDAIIERVKTTCVPAGEFETNPLSSVPDVVKSLTKKYKISDDAAALYLQVASLPFPSDANIRFWNGWKKKQHDVAIAELVKKKLVVSAKRSRASRTIFIHGHWAEKVWEKPIESWKFKHLGWLNTDGQYTSNRPFSKALSLQPPHVLFERVWERIKSGDAPGFEEVK